MQIINSPLIVNEEVCFDFLNKTQCSNKYWCFPSVIPSTCQVRLLHVALIGSSPKLEYDILCSSPGRASILVRKMPSISTPATTGNTFIDNLHRVLNTLCTPKLIFQAMSIALGESISIIWKYLEFHSYRRKRQFDSIEVWPRLIVEAK